MKLEDFIEKYCPENGLRPDMPFEPT